MKHECKPNCFEKTKVRWQKINIAGNDGAMGWFCFLQNLLIARVIASTV